MSLPRTYANVRASPSPSEVRWPESLSNGSLLDDGAALLAALSQRYSLLWTCPGKKGQCCAIRYEWNFGLWMLVHRQCMCAYTCNNTFTFTLIQIYLCIHKRLHTNITHFLSATYTHLICARARVCVFA